jgi:hypothetical protein
MDTQGAPAATGKAYFFSSGVPVADPNARARLWEQY